MTLMCSICAMEFDDKDPDWNTRKARHEDKHSGNRHSINDSDKIMKANNSIGVVTWITVW